MFGEKLHSKLEQRHNQHRFLCSALTQRYHNLAMTLRSRVQSVATQMLNIRHNDIVIKEHQLKVCLGRRFETVIVGVTVAACLF